MKIDVTREELLKIKDIEKGTFYYNVVQRASPGGDLSKLERKLLSLLPDEIDLGCFSKVLLYGKNLPKERYKHIALLKLIQRRYFKVYKVDKVEEYSGFTYILCREIREIKPEDKFYPYNYIKIGDRPNQPNYELSKDFKEDINDNNKNG